jgi:hypothetical protein
VVDPSDVACFCLLLEHLFGFVSSDLFGQICLCFLFVCLFLCVCCR